MLSAADRQMAEELVRDRALSPLPSSHLSVSAQLHNKTAPPSQSRTSLPELTLSLIAALIFTRTLRTTSRR